MQLTHLKIVPLQLGCNWHPTTKSGKQKAKVNYLLSKAKCLIPTKLYALIMINHKDLTVNGKINHSGEDGMSTSGVYQTLQGI